MVFRERLYDSKEILTSMEGALLYKYTSPDHL